MHTSILDIIILIKTRTDMDHVDYTIIICVGKCMISRQTSNCLGFVICRTIKLRIVLSNPTSQISKIIL